MASHSSARRSPGYSTDAPRRTSEAPACDTSHSRSGGAWYTAEWRTDRRTSGSGRAARYGPPRPHAPCGTPNREASGSIRGIRDGALVSPSAPPQRVPPDGQAGPGDVRTTIERRLDRAFIHADLGTLHLPENRGALLNLQPIQQLLPRHGRQLQDELLVFRSDGGLVGDLHRWRTGTQAERRGRSLQPAILPFAVGSQVLDGPDHVVLQPRESTFAGRLALPQPVDLELGKVDLLLQMRQELAHPVALFDRSGQGGLELRPELLLMLRGNQLGGFDQRRELILDHIQRRSRNRGRRNYGQGCHHATSGCATMRARRR